jgi:hypothetical protein
VSAPLKWNQLHQKEKPTPHRHKKRLVLAKGRPCTLPTAAISSISWPSQRPAQTYCSDLLCRLTCSAVRRMRRLMAACSLRANASITAMSFAVGVGLRRKSARRNQGTWKLSLSFWVEASGTVTASFGGRGLEFFNGISAARQGQSSAMGKSPGSCTKVS